MRILIIEDEEARALAALVKSESNALGVGQYDVNPLRLRRKLENAETYDPTARPLSREARDALGRQQRDYTRLAALTARLKDVAAGGLPSSAERKMWNQLLDSLSCSLDDLERLDVLAQEGK